MSTSTSRAARLVGLVFLAAVAAACSSPGGIAPPAAGPGGMANVPNHPEGHRTPHRCIVSPGHSCTATPGPSPAPTGISYDVINHHGTLLTSFQSKVVYFGYQSSWGDQTTLLKNLYASQFFAHLMAQYVPNHGAYTVAAPAYETAPIGYYDDQSFTKHAYYDVSAILKTVATVAGANTGPHYLYHIITPGDLPYCSTNGTSCTQSPCGNLGTCSQTECAEHDYGQPGNGNVFYTIQGDPGTCNLFTNIGASPLAYATANTEQTLDSTVLHEVMEAITDPYYGNASPASQMDYGWVGNGDEIADICEGFGANMDLNGTGYFAQAIWSNADQKCYYIPHLILWPIIVDAQRKHGSPIPRR